MREEFAGERLVDNNHRCGTFAVPTIEVATFQKRRAQGRKVTRRHKVEVHQRVVSFWRVGRIHLNSLIPLEIAYRRADGSAYGHHPGNCRETALDIVEHRVLPERWDFCRF